MTNETALFTEGDVKAALYTIDVQRNWEANGSSMKAFTPEKGIRATEILLNPALSDDQESEEYLQKFVVENLPRFERGHELLLKYDLKSTPRATVILPFRLKDLGKKYTIVSEPLTWPSGYVAGAEQWVQIVLVERKDCDNE